MDHKPAKAKSMLMRFLPKVASSVSVSFQNPNPPFSPTHKRPQASSENANKLKTHLGKGFSGPMVSLIPKDAGRKPNNSSFEAAQEPTSPKISCMGQIKHKKKHQQNNTTTKTKQQQHHQLKPFSSPPPEKTIKHSKFKTVASFSEGQQKKTSRIKSMFKPAAGRTSDASADHCKQPLPDRAPSLSQMKRFASGRDTFSNFDWAAQIAPVDSDLDSYRNNFDNYDNESDGEDEGPIIPFSAPILVGGGGKVALEPRKEINLWKRRTMAQPKPLRLNV